MLFLTLLACRATTEEDPESVPADTGEAPPVVERHLRANYELEEGLNLADGEIVVLGANNETEPEAEHADVHATLGRYIGLATYAPSGEGRLCEVGEGFTTVEDVPDECASEWAMNVACAVNSESSEPACVGLGLLVQPLENDALYRVRVVTDGMETDGDYLAGITIEVQEAR